MVGDGEDASEIDTEALSPPPPPPLPDFSLTNKPIPVITTLHYNVDESGSLEKHLQRLTNAETHLHETPFYVVNTPLQPQLQEGPKCGLVALSIATSCTNSFKSADELFIEAVNQGFTSQGEMYSCQNMACLVESETKFKPVIIQCGINSHIDCIFHCLQNGGLMLVPYDADRNHSPCCRRGHSAHWAVVSGIAVFREADPDGGRTEPYDDEVLSLPGGPFPACRCVPPPTDAAVEIRRSAGAVRIAKRGGSVDRGGTASVYLVGRQGKSRHLAVWSWEKLAESNDNLEELSRQQTPRNFVLPEGGVAAGLKGSAVLLPG